MSDLVEFLRARLDEDEARARGRGKVVVHAPEEPAWYGYSSRRVLAEVEAKRSILDDHTTPHTVVDGFCVEEGGECRHVGEAACSWHGTDNCPTVRALALSYATHDAYREEWRL